jgi:hypothetical protein
VPAKYPGLIGTWTGWEPNALDGRDADFAGTASSDASGHAAPPHRCDGRREVLGSLSCSRESGVYLASLIGVAAMRRSGIKDRGAYDAVLRDVLAANPGLIGTWTGWEPRGSRQS